MSDYLVEMFVPGLHGEPLLVYFAYVHASDNRIALNKARALYFGSSKKRRPTLKLVKAVGDLNSQ